MENWKAPTIGTTWTWKKEGPKEQSNSLSITIVIASSKDLHKLHFSYTYCYPTTYPPTLIHAHKTCLHHFFLWGVYLTRHWKRELDIIPLQQEMCFSCPHYECSLSKLNQLLELKCLIYTGELIHTSNPHLILIVHSWKICRPKWGRPFNTLASLEKGCAKDRKQNFPLIGLS